MRCSPARRAARFPAGQPEQGRVSRGGPGGGHTTGPNRLLIPGLRRGGASAGTERSTAPLLSPSTVSGTGTAPTPTGNRDGFCFGFATALALPLPLDRSTPFPLPAPAFFAPLPVPPSTHPPPGPQLPARPRGSRSAAPALPRDPAAAAGRRKDGDETCSAAGECRGKHGGGLGVRPTHTPPPPPHPPGPGVSPPGVPCRSLGRDRRCLWDCLGRRCCRGGDG